MKLISVSFLSFATVAGAFAQAFLMMPDSTNNRVVTFDPMTGSVISISLFSVAAGTTPVHAMQVGQEIWISEQVGDKISRYDAAGSSLGTISGGLDNVRGMGLIGGTVYVTNSGTANGASGNSVRSYDTSGNFLSFFATPNAPSPFGILDYQGGMLVSSSTATDDVHKYSLGGIALGTFHNSTSLNFAEQMDYAINGDILIAGFSSNNITRHDAATGALLSSFTASGARGVHQLGNGNILWSSGTGVFIWDGASSTQIYTGSGRYIDLYTPVPEPATLIVIGAGVAALARKRRSKKA